jgi:guanine nucleotide-binding protein subunit alpha
MKLIYAQGFSKSEKLEWKPVVFNNVVQAFQVILEAMNEMDIHFENPENEVNGTQFPILVTTPCVTSVSLVS